MPEDDGGSGGVTVRIPDWLADELEEEIQKHPRGKRPTRGELLAEAWKLSRAPGGPKAPTDSINVQRLREIEESGQSKVIDAVSLNIEIFHDHLPARRRPRPKSLAAGAVLGGFIS